MQKIIISSTEWEHDKTHYLYVITPKVVLSKIEKIIEKKEKPEITEDLLNSMSEFFEKADIILYPTEENAQWIEKQFKIFTDCLARMAFIPGGFELFGKHYEVVDDESEA